MSRLINIGFGNTINTDRLIAVIGPDAAPVRRMIQNAREQKKCIDATQGRKTKAVLVMDNDFLVLSALVPETITRRFSMNETAGVMMTEQQM